MSISGLTLGAEATSSVHLSRRVAKALRRPDPLPTEAHVEEALKRASGLEAFAKSELERGFPYLHGIAAIKMWSLLEGLVDDVVGYRLKTQDLASFPALNRVKGNLAAFFRATESERVEILVERLKELTDAPLKRGCGRFEAPLDAVGLGGSMDDNARKFLFELSEVRNVIVHRNARADRRFIEACPWLRAAVGAPVVVTSDSYIMYDRAVCWYMLEIDCRLAQFDGEPTSLQQAEVQRELTADLQKFMSERETNGT